MTEDELQDLENDRLYAVHMSEKLVGKKYVFDDGDSIEVIQIKSRGPGQHYVTFHIQQGPGISRKLILPMAEFSTTYGHLFGEQAK